jgi:hypothetical protein
MVCLLLPTINSSSSSFNQAIPPSTLRLCTGTRTLIFDYNLLMEIKKSLRGITSATDAKYIEETIALKPLWYVHLGDGKARIMLGISEKQVQTVGIMREPTIIGAKVPQGGGNMQEENHATQTIKVPKFLSFPLKSEIQQPSEFLETLDRAFIVYQSLFMQASVNREKV